MSYNMIKKKIYKKIKKMVENFKISFCNNN